MTELPTGWAKATLGDLLLRIEAGKSFRCEGRPARPDEWGIIKVSAMTWGEFQEVENKAVRPEVEIDPENEIKPGDILLSRANTEAYVGASVFVEDCRPRLLLSDKSLRLVPSPSIDRRWFAYLLSSLGMRKEIARRATGTKDSMRNISQSSLREIDLLVPPLSEQRRIVVTLEGHLLGHKRGTASLLTAMRRAEKLRSSFGNDAVRGLATQFQEHGPTGQGLLSEVSSRRRGRVSRRRREASPPGASLGVEIPSHWTVASIDQLCWDIQYGSSAKAHIQKSEGDVPVIRMGNIRQGRIDMTDLKYLPARHDDLKTLMLTDGDLLFNRTNSAELVGKSAVYRSSIGLATFASYLIRCRIIEGVEPDWVNLVINSAVGRQYVRSVLSQQVGQANVNGAKLAAMPIPLPPHSEQVLILEHINSQFQILDDLGVSFAALSSKGNNLHRALLADAFAGRLVEQDPVDEPASVLLQRIRAERAAQGPVRRARHGKDEKAPQKETLL